MVHDMFHHARIAGINLNNCIVLFCITTTDSSAVLHSGSLTSVAGSKKVSILQCLLFAFAQWIPMLYNSTILAFCYVFNSGHTIDSQSMLLLYKDFSQVVLIQFIKKFLSVSFCLFRVRNFWYSIPFRFCFLSVQVLLNFLWTYGFFDIN